MSEKTNLDRAREAVETAKLITATGVWLDLGGCNPSLHGTTPLEVRATTEGALWKWTRLTEDDARRLLALRNATDAIQGVIGELELLRAIVKRNGETFRFYQGNHEQKAEQLRGDGAFIRAGNAAHKAEVNRKLADDCERALRGEP